MTRLKTLAALALSFALTGVALAAGGEGDAHAAKAPKAQTWTWDGAFGHFDRQQLQRGFQVYKEVCASCHSMKLLSFRNLSQPGGPEFSEAQMKAIAASYKIKALDDKGEEIERPGIPADPNSRSATTPSSSSRPAAPW